MQVNAIQMSTHNVCFYKENQKKEKKKKQILPQDFLVILKNLRAQSGN